MPDLKAWRVKHRELVDSCRVIGKRFGEKAVDDVAERHMENIRAAFRKKAEDLGRDGLSVLAEGFEKITDTHVHEIVRQGDRVLEIKVTRCAHAEIFAECHAEDIGRKFMCAGDQAMIDGLNPKITMERSQVIMNGDPICHFIYRLDA
jgi:predicted ArsR family transcriptional regulator